MTDKLLKLLKYDEKLYDDYESTVQSVLKPKFLADETSTHLNFIY